VDLICDQMLIPGCETVVKDSNLGLLLMQVSHSRGSDAGKVFRVLYCNRLIQGMGRCRLLLRVSPPTAVPPVSNRAAKVGTSDAKAPTEAIKRLSQRASTSIDITLPDIAISINISTYEVLSDIAQRFGASSPRDSVTHETETVEINAFNIQDYLEEVSLQRTLNVLKLLEDESKVVVPSVYSAPADARLDRVAQLMRKVCFL
jgi:hypothetical protein